MIPRTVRAFVARLLTLSIFLILPTVFLGGTHSKAGVEGDDPTVSQPSVQTFVRIVELQTNDIVFNPQTQKIHASIPSSAGPSGNSIAEIDPVSGSIGQSVFIGSEPNKLALSTDGQVLYASLDGAAAIRRFDVVTHIPGQQFSLGNDPGFGSPFLAADLAVAPGNSNLLAVARTRPFVSPSGQGVVVFDNGVQRQNVGSSFDSSTFLSSLLHRQLFTAVHCSVG